MSLRQRTSPSPDRSLQNGKYLQERRGISLKLSVYNDHDYSSDISFIPGRHQGRRYRDQAMHNHWQACTTFLVITFVCCLGIPCVYINQLRRLGDKIKAYPAGWFNEHAVDRLQEQANALKAHLKARLLRGSQASKADQAKAYRVLDEIIDQEVQEVASDDEGMNGEDDDAEYELDDDDTQDSDDTEYKSPEVPSRYADRHIRNFLDIAESETCKDPTVDLSDPNFDPNEAAEIFSKCRLLVLRNAYDIDLMKHYRAEFAKFIKGIKDGRISTEGSHTRGDPMFFAMRGNGRYEIILPERLAHPEIIGNKNILDVIQHKSVLGKHSALRSLQSLLAEGSEDNGGMSQPWHFDQDLLFGSQDGALDEYGIAGHDLPPAVASVAIPLLDMTDRNVGPTEFCLGTSAIRGVGDEPRVLDKSLVSEDSPFRRYVHDSVHCPAELWRAPLLNLGDAVVWDYNLLHRGGWNTSPYLRSLVVLVFSRKWFDELNYSAFSNREPPPGEPESVTELLWRTRFGVAKHDEKPTKKVSTPLEKLGSLAPMVKEKEKEKEHFAEHPQKTAFVVSNSNVANNPTLYLNGVSQGHLPAGSSKTLSCAFGDLVELRSGSEIAGQFAKCSAGGQFFFAQDGTAVAAS